MILYYTRSFQKVKHRNFSLILQGKHRFSPEKYEEIVDTVEKVAYHTLILFLRELYKVS